MKQKVLVVASAVLLAGGAVFGFTSPAPTADCPMKGTPECPLLKDCPDKGTAACTLAGVPACCAQK
ncbi:hypothetical protein GCM10011375_39690 [Hymenobacter qilianensis]|uniref:Uncharacterized protein n=2 Tax=Hymenobacter qilianensis TaxID=1385715 RepID=A0ACB5PX78_9BACT|nr:hypothetical protein [Hymenobacter qilianensis]QNP54446.1 hypothetical protein H9L05_21990 [Hymenobacter qilianensis]GGF80660.1 hypothetical protein GCM10011375_39690 [Hymenobacter qilianensis]